jgi:predicted amino acid-binding ACT domain protein
VATIFVSSRMELEQERKAVFEAVHFSEHTPVLIDQEPRGPSTEEAKRVMDDMIMRSSGFVGIYGLELGGPNTAFLGGRAPIEYEYEEFAKRLRDCTEPPIWLYANRIVRRHADDGIGRFLAARDAECPRVQEFDSLEHLSGLVRENILNHRSLQKRKDTTEVAKDGSRLCVRVVCEDKSGLIAKIAECLFEKMFNIDYISHACMYGHATLLISCSPRGDHPAGDAGSRAASVCGSLRYRLRAFLSAPGDVVVQPVRRLEGDNRYVYTATIRNLDSPGVLLRVSSTLKDELVNIEQIRLAPAEKQFHWGRQAEVHFELSVHLADAERHGGKELFAVRVENRLRCVLGVMSATIRYLHKAPADIVDWRSDAISGDTQ